MNLVQLDADLVLFILYIIFISVTAIQVFYFWGIFARLLFFNKRSDEEIIQPVSVVISAKNEYFNLKNNLPLILNQDHPDFEVVVVNDSSDDETLELLEDISKIDKKLRIVNIPQSLNFFTGKKFPLSIGIKSAKNDIIVLTDADCRPASERWLRKMQSNLKEGKNIVLGYGGYESRNGLLNKLIQFDTLQIAIQYLSYALAKVPYMGVGRNLAYRKSLFYDNKGFTSHYKIQSGDDDLFINKVANENNTSIEIDPESHTISTPKKSFSEWVRQKRRHLGTGKYYKSKHKFLLGLYSLSKFLFYAIFIILIAFVYNINIILPLFILRLISFLIVYKICMKKFAVNNLLLISPFLEIFFVIFIPILIGSGLLHKIDKWK